MKQTEDIIFSVAKKTIIDLGWVDQSEEGITFTILNTRFDKQKECFKGKKKGEFIPLWTIYILAKSPFLSEILILLTISDDEAKPLYFQNSQVSVSELGIDKNCKVFIMEDIWKLK